MSDKNKDQPTPPEQDAEKAPSAIAVKLLSGLKASAGVAKKIAQNKTILDTKAKILAFGITGWMKVLGGIAIAALTVVIYKTAPHWNSLWQLPYLSSFEGVADKKFNISSDNEIIRYDNDLLSPQHVVLINKIVVNIRSTERSTDNPMVAFDLYVRTDTEQAAVEIKEREKQLQDHLQRFCESLHYDQIQTEEGKTLWKNRMRRELNLVLNTGRVKEVFFKTLLIKR